MGHRAHHRPPGTAPAWIRLSHAVTVIDRTPADLRESAIADARERYVAGEIEVDEFELLVDRALSIDNPMVLYLGGPGHATSY